MIDYEAKFYKALRTIAKDFNTIDGLRKRSQKEYGLDYQEALEMAYENIQELAKAAIAGYRKKKVKEDG